MRPKATNTTVIYRHISFYTPRPRAQRVAPTSPVFQRVQPNLRSYTPIFYRLFLAFSTFNRIIFFSNSHKKPRSARCLWKICGFSRGLRPLKDTAPTHAPRRHAPHATHPAQEGNARHATPTPTRPPCPPHPRRSSWAIPRRRLTLAISQRRKIERRLSNASPSVCRSDPHAAR